jgi:hypothetical protein
MRGEETFKVLFCFVGIAKALVAFALLLFLLVGKKRVKL